MAFPIAQPLPVHPAHEANNDVLYMMLPLLAMATYFYGWRPAILCVVAIVTAIFCDKLVAILRSRPYDKTENSSLVSAMIFVMLLPASVEYYVVIVGVIIVVLIGKAAFGGFGMYPFNPGALGFAVVAVSWPNQAFRYPVPFAPLALWKPDTGLLVESASHTLRVGGLPNISGMNLVLGNYAGPMGATAILVLLSCAAYLWMRKRFTLAAPVGFFFMCALMAFLFPRLGEIGITWPWVDVMARLSVVKFELLTGALLFAGIFLINEPCTLPKSEASRFVYGLVVGFATMMFRYFGSYDLGVCFAILAINSIAGYIDRFVLRCTGHKEVLRSDG